MDTLNASVLRSFPAVDAARADALLRSVKISDGVQSLVGRLGVTPAFVVAKGGITSSDAGVKAEDRTNGEPHGPMKCVS